MTAFEVLASDGAARRGRLATAHGAINTPAFMPVGTAATVKGMLPEQVAGTGAEIILGNTYHLMLRPGAERVADLGGLHRFMNWPGPILTDSGGFQVMSLAGLRKLTEQGVTFRSHLDGTLYDLTPERSLDIQYKLDADITMCFDECTPWPATEAQAAESMRLSMRWARRCREVFVERPGYGLFGIVQGSVYPALRAESAAALTGLGFDGYAVGGLAVGEGQELMLATLESTAPLLPADRPRYLMATRSGRTGQGFTKRGTNNIRNARHAADPRPLEEGCTCPACRSYSRAYLHHLFRAQEMLGPMLLTWHNLQHYQDLMRGLRAAIETGRLAAFVAAFTAEEALGDIEPLAGAAEGDEP